MVESFRQIIIPHHLSLGGFLIMNSFAFVLFGQSCSLSDISLQPAEFILRIRDLIVKVSAFFDRSCQISIHLIVGILIRDDLVLQGVLLHLELVDVSLQIVNLSFNIVIVQFQISAVVGQQLVILSYA
jgi:hypothetical protein